MNRIGKAESKSCSRTRTRELFNNQDCVVVLFVCFVRN